MKLLKVMTFAVVILSLFFVLGCVTPTNAIATDATGKWVGTGIDTRGVMWSFTFILTQNGSVLTGTSEWKGSDGSIATTTVKGSVDLAKMTFSITDVDLDLLSGDVMAGTCTGSFSNGFQKMTGKWTVPGGSPGTFTGSRK